MAPNRKAHTHILQQAANPNLVAVQAAKAFVDPQAVVSKNESASYWEWPADEKVQNLQKEKDIADLFSVEHITANLVAAAEQLEHELEQVTELNNHADEKEDYWNESTPVVPTVSPKAVRHVTIKGMFSADHIQSNLIKGCSSGDHLQQQQKQNANSNDEANNDKYWEWEWPAWKHDGNKSLQQQERDNKLLSTQHVERNLVQYGEQIEQHKHGIDNHELVAANDEYWAL